MASKKPAEPAQAAEPASAEQRKPTLWDALFAAQQDCRPLLRDSGGNGDIKWTYTSAESTVRALRGIMAGHGLMVSIHSTEVLVAASSFSAVQLDGMLTHWPSCQQQPLRMQLPISPHKGFPESRAAQASITSGLARLLRSLLLVVTTDEEEVDSPRPEERSSATRNPEPVERTEAPPKEQETPSSTSAATTPASGGDERDGDDLRPEEEFIVLADSVGLNHDAASMWATRLQDDRGNKTAQLGTYETMCQKPGMLAKGIDMLREDLEKMKQRGMASAAFNKMVTEWARDQIPF